MSSIISKGCPFLLYKPFIDAYMRCHTEVATSLRHYNALAEWDLIKTNEKLIKEKIQEYFDASRQHSNSLSNQELPPASLVARKRSISSDDGEEIPDPLYDPDVVVPVTPTFSHRSATKIENEEDSSKPWIVRGIERAKARVEAQRAKIEARRLAKELRIKTPAQESVLKDIKEINERIESLNQVKNMGLSTEESTLTLKRLLQQKKERTAELSLLRSKQRAGLRYRARRKQRLETLCAADPEVATELLKIYSATTIQIQIDDVCPRVLNTIEEIARIVGLADPYPKPNAPQRCKNLDELRLRIKERGYEIRRTALFYRLIPAGAFSEDGKRHGTTTAVRLRKLQGIERKVHPDCHFVSAILRHIKDLAGTFGNDCVMYLVQDTKASVRIGRQANRGHSPLIMRLDYQTSTVDGGPIPSSFKYQLKPIVYASCIIDENGLVTNEGPTYISIRSAKHDQYDTEWDEIDFERAVKLRDFERTARNHIGEIKPIIIINVDRIDPIDHTRYSKTLHLAIKKFKKYNLDALIMVTPAAGQSLFNIAERRLALLSHDLPGLVLPDYYYGTHLDENGVTIDADIEKENFKRAGQTLAEVWNMDLIDRHTVVAEYIDPPAYTNDMTRSVDCQLTLNQVIDEVCDDDEDIPLHQRIQRARPALYPNLAEDTKPKPVYPIDEYWCATHVFQTQYTIQIVRCTKPECCGPWRSNYVSVFPHRFLPAPVPFHRSSSGVRIADIECSAADFNPVSPFYGTLYQRIQFHGILMRRTQNKMISFDHYCPSIQDFLYSRICSICNQYIPEPLRLRNHYKVHQQRYALGRTGVNDSVKKEEETMEDANELIDPSDLPKPPVNFSEGSVFLFTDLTDWLRSDFEEDRIVEQKPKSIAAQANAMIRKDKQNTSNSVSITEAEPVMISEASNSTTANLTNGLEDNIQSVATFSVDSALDTDDMKTVKSEVKVEHDSMIDQIEQLNVNDDENSSFSIRTDSYDDLSDLLDKI